MLGNYSKVAFRYLIKHKMYSFINAAGLAIGMACFILIMLWVRHELSFDKFHKNANDLYIVANEVKLGDKIEYWRQSPPALGPALKAEYPEVRNSARVLPRIPFVLNYQGKSFDEIAFAADPDFLSMFTFPLVSGDATTALKNPHALIISPKMAHKYFDDQDPLGKIVKLDNKFDFIITGILENIPQNSFFQFECLLPLSFLEEKYPGTQLDVWTHHFDYLTFVLLEPGTSPEIVKTKIHNRIYKEKKEAFPFLKPFVDLHLYGIGFGQGNISQVRVFTFIAFLVLLIACINFTNLATARSGNRAKEIGVRKVSGAYRLNIINQFYSESLLLAFISFLIAVLLADVFLPFFNSLMGTELRLDLFKDLFFLVLLLATTLVTGLLAGSFPALYISTFQPVKIMKGTFNTGTIGNRFRTFLVIVQFVISISLIISVLVINNQLNFMLEKDVGYDEEQLLYIPLRGTLQQQSQIAKQQFLQVSGVLNASLTSHSPTGIYSNYDGWEWQGKRPDINPLVTAFRSDENLLQTFKMDMVRGDFYTESTAPTKGNNDKIVINETFAKMMNMDNPVGARLSRGSNQYKIMGVIKDFHFKPLYEKIEPLVVLHDPSRFRFLFLRIATASTGKTIQNIEKVYKSLNPEYPFDFYFLDEQFYRIYRSEIHAGSLIRIFSVLAIIISCLGLYGLSSFLAEKRTKEIGIRKTIGASTHGILFLFSIDFVKWVVIASFFSCPISFYLMNKWLQNFAYRVNIEWWIFLFAIIIALVITLFTVGFQTIKVGKTNPVTSLRYE